MTRIGLISDTHGYFDEAIWIHFKNCDEIWHAGDWGSGLDALIERTDVKGVYGNIDGAAIRSMYPEQLVFHCEEVKVMIRHIGAYPPN